MMLAQKRSLNTYQDIPKQLNIWPVLSWKSDYWSSVLNRDCAVLNLYPKADNKTTAAETIFFLTPIFQENTHFQTWRQRILTALMDDGSATWEKRTFIEVYVQYEKHSNN